MARNMVIAGILLLLMTFGGCASDRVEFSAGKHEKEDAYQLTAICAEQRPLVRLPAATWRSPTATLVKVFR